VLSFRGKFRGTFGSYRKLRRLPEPSPQTFLQSITEGAAHLYGCLCCVGPGCVLAARFTAPFKHDLEFLSSNSANFDGSCVLAVHPLRLGLVL